MSTSHRRAICILTSGVFIVIVAGLVTGLGIAQYCWKSSPITSRVDKETLYLMRFGQALEALRASKTNSAKEHLSLALAESPTRYECHALLGDLLMGEGNTNAAIASYRQALQYCGASPTNLVPASGQIIDKHRLERKLHALGAFSVTGN